MLIKLNDNVYINPEHISAIGVAGAKKDGDLPMASITLHCGDTLRVPAEGLIEKLTEAGVIAPEGAEPIELFDNDVAELRRLHAAGFRWLAADKRGVAAYETKPEKAEPYWEGGMRCKPWEDLSQVAEPDAPPVSITALLQSWEANA